MNIIENRILYTYRGILSNKKVGSHSTITRRTAARSFYQISTSTGELGQNRRQRQRSVRPNPDIRQRALVAGEGHIDLLALLGIGRVLRMKMPKFSSPPYSRGGSRMSPPSLQPCCLLLILPMCKLIETTCHKLTNDWSIAK